MAALCPWSSSTHFPPSLQVLETYSSSFNFRGLTFDAAIRLYLESFRLPGGAAHWPYLVGASVWHNAEKPGSLPPSWAQSSLGPNPKPLDP